MIHIDITGLFFIYLLVFLAVVFFVWITSEAGRRLRETSGLRGKTQCAICGLVYAVPRDGGPRPCPRCGTRNERNPVNRI
jgi:hypothetical protein